MVRGRGGEMGNEGNKGVGDWEKKYDKGQGGVGERESRRWEVGDI